MTVEPQWPKVQILLELRFPNPKVEFGAQTAFPPMLRCHSWLQLQHQSLVETAGWFVHWGRLWFVLCVVDDADNGLILIRVAHPNNLKPL
jgi:hypothetical protein